MRAEFTATIEDASKRGYRAICSEIPRTNGRGKTAVEDAKNSLRNARRLT